MKFVVIGARILLGAPFLVFGLNGFFDFLDMAGEHSAEAQAFLGALDDTGYLMALLAGTQVACGALLVLGVFVPLALTVLAPVLLNIILFHVYLDRQGIEMAIALCVLELLLVWWYRNNFWSVLAIRARPAAASDS